MTSRVEMAGRLGQLRSQLPEADAIVVSAPADLRWLTAFTGSNGILIVFSEEAHFVTDGRYTEQAEHEVCGAHVHVAKGDLFVYAAESILAGVSDIAIQSDHLTVAKAAQFRKLLPDSEWEEVQNLSQRLRATKSESELALIRGAQSITEAALLDTLKVIRPGVTELEVAAALVYSHLSRGASGMSFDPIVASGPNAALPHARPTQRKIQAGELILMDMGCFFEGYASDMTRMICIGPPTAQGQEVVDQVRGALECAEEFARAGLVSRDLDSKARDYLTGAGLGELFTHSLGHGVGLQIHEWPPVSFRSSEVLPEGAVITMEPGVYLPGVLGVRIEDMFVLRDKGVERITTMSRDLIIV